MLRSIRWRLVVSFTLLTLLTVGAIGVMAYTLVEQRLARQEQEYLRANAEAIARQAQRLMSPVADTRALQQLVRTASFLSNVQVRVLDAQRRTMADSGLPLAVEEVTWYLPSQPSTMTAAAPVVVFSVAEAPAGWPVEAFATGISPAPVDADIMVVQRTTSLFGDRLFFPTTKDGEAMASVTVRPSEVISSQSIESNGDLAVYAEPMVQRSSETVVAPIEQGGHVIGFVELSNGPDLRLESLATLRNALNSAGIAAGLLALALGFVASRGLTAPLATLTTAAQRMRSGDLSARAPVRGNTEISALARQFNAMAADLEQSFADLAAERDALRRFVADASHELRTPITALRTFNELLLDSDADEATRREFLVESATLIDRLEWITGHLLGLSRLDAGLTTLEMAEHDLGEVLAAAAAPFASKARTRDITMEIKLPEPPLQVSCDRRRLELALANLLDNALKYTAARGSVVLGAELEPDHIHIWVQDTGAGIPADALPHVFERFYHGSGEAAGSGLGLAIVQSIVRAHKGQVTASSVLGLGSRFDILLPVAAAEHLTGH
ncbi:MAG: HAMP domain-containing histidine kinase [Caldilineaceae bacterium]|nr:HAMP domain-containing histidine kinase [Caldilineaceae bacterium]